MGRIFLTSDLHLGHNKEFLYKPRGFNNIDDHDLTLINNWNSIITEPDDEVYIIGDIMLADYEYGKSCFNKLNGLKHIIIGNHDTDTRVELYKDLNGVLDVKLADRIKYKKRTFYLTHYPMLVGPLCKRNGIYDLHGHTHHDNRFEFIDNKCYNVNLDAHEMKPISIDKIIEDIEDYKNNH